MRLVRIVLFSVALAVGTTLASMVFAYFSLKSGIDVAASEYFDIGAALIHGIVCFVGYFLLARLPSGSAYLQMLVVYLLATLLTVLPAVFLLGESILQKADVVGFLWPLTIAAIATKIGVVSRGTNNTFQQVT